MYPIRPPPNYPQFKKAKWVERNIFKMENLYVYPCEESNECIEFLEGYKTMSFAEFCKTVCGSGCPHCVYMDIPYTEDMFKNE